MSNVAEIVESESLGIHGAVGRAIIAGASKLGRGSALLRGAEFKSLHTDINADTESRRVEFYASSFGIRDQVNDVVVKGAYKKTINDEGGQNLIKFFWNHETLLGRVISLEETDEGLKAIGEIDPHPSLDVYLEHIKSGAAAHGSIGYRVVKSSFGTKDGERVRFLEEIKLHEVSVVIWPCNTASEVVGIKGLFEASEIVEAAAYIEWYTDKIERLTGQEWAQITEDQRQHLVSLLDQLVGSEESIRKGLETASQSTKTEAAEVSGVDTKARDALQRYVGQLNQIVGGQHG